MACAMVWPWAGPDHQRPQDQHVERALQHVAAAGLGSSWHAGQLTPLDILWEAGSCGCRRQNQVPAFIIGPPHPSISYATERKSTIDGPCAALNEINRLGTGRPRTPPAACRSVATFAAAGSAGVPSKEIRHVQRRRLAAVYPLAWSSSVSTVCSWHPHRS